MAVIGATAMPAGWHFPCSIIRCGQAATRGGAPCKPSSVSSASIPMLSGSSRPCGRRISPQAASASCRRSTPESALRAAVPTTEAEPPGIGGTIGSVVGGAAGTAGGLAVASLALPGVGPVIAVGALAWACSARPPEARSARISTTRSPRDFPRTSSTSTATPCGWAGPSWSPRSTTTTQARRVRELMTTLGAESVDAAREEWWIGLRDAEEAEYTRAGATSGRTRRSTARDSTRRSAAGRGAPLGGRAPAAARAAWPRRRGAGLPRGLRARSRVSVTIPRLMAAITHAPSRLQALERGVRAARPGSPSRSRREGRVRLCPHLRPLPSVVGSPRTEPVCLGRPRRHRSRDRAPHRGHRRDVSRSSEPTPPSSRMRPRRWPP